jgi:hypothetical protein
MQKEKKERLVYTVNSVICALDKIEVSGVTNMKAVIGSIQQLSNVVDEIKAEAEDGQNNAIERQDL